MHTRCDEVWELESHLLEYKPRSIIAGQHQLAIASQTSIQEGDFYFADPGNRDFPAARLASSAPLRLNCEGMPSTRCVELMFLTSVIW